MSGFRLAVFDVDGTLTRVESCWRFIHERLGTWENGGKKNAERFFRGEISYEDWAQMDAALWKNVPVEKIRQIIAEIPLTEGIGEVFEFLGENGVKIVLLSAGRSMLAERIVEKFHIDCYVANELEVEDGKITGKVKVKVSLSNKGEILEEILRKFNVKHEACLAVGDDETMIPVFQKVGLSIAFNPRNRQVEKYAKVIVKSRDLKEIIPYIRRYMKCKSNV